MIIRKHMKTAMCAFCSMLLGVAWLVTASPATAATVQDDARLVLKVAPYPDIPGDYSRMLGIIESGFETEHPEIDLQLTVMSIVDAYDIDTLEAFMTKSLEAGGVHVMEIDTTMLGDLPHRGVVAPQTYRQNDWNRNIVDASSYQGTLYGVPHWSCGNFIITRYPHVAKATNPTELAAALYRAKPQGPWLGGNWAGDAYMALYYSQAVAENYPYLKDLNPIMTQPADKYSAFTMKTAADLCVEKGVNPCVDGTHFFDPARYVEKVVNGEYAATFGFSETMWYMMQYGANPDDWYISPLPIGVNARHVAVGDSYVVRKGLSAEVQQAVSLFYDFMMKDETYYKIIMSGGAEGEDVPRYVIPARTTLLDSETLMQYPYYRRIRDAVRTRNSVAHPNLLVPENRGRIYEAVMQVLNAPVLPKSRINWRNNFKKPKQNK